MNKIICFCSGPTGGLEPPHPISEMYYPVVGSKQKQIFYFNEIHKLPSVLTNCLASTDINQLHRVIRKTNFTRPP